MHVDLLTVEIAFFQISCENFTVRIQYYSSYGFIPRNFVCPNVTAWFHSGAYFWSSTGFSLTYDITSGLSVASSEDIRKLI